ncbi:MAG: NAD(P)(+) transhydrogenase (Re/Si-specific) subunit beta, partial [Myxococcales bacterium]|nr:NAD(P)(+) transhydrogenase (Re/Si-specific) subunit beta [Myxococcales bacterium]
MGNELIIAYLVAGVLFIRSLGGLSQQDTARRGNLYGVLGMVIAIAATVLQERIESHSVIVGAIVIGSIVGALLARRVAMTAMPQLVALLHSFVGLAAVLVGISSHLHPGEEFANLVGAEHVVHNLEIWIGVAV